MTVRLWRRYEGRDDSMTKKSAVVAPDEVVQDAYINWLLEKLRADQFDEDSKLLLIHLHLLEWYSVLDKDIQREEDGKSIRERFIQESDFINYDGIQGPCTVLECLYGIAERIDYFCTPPEYIPMSWMYFWKLLYNAGILGHGIDVYAIDRAVDRVLSRSFTAKGTGGLFPLKHPSTNQIGTEIWYQMSAYVFENPRLFPDLLQIFVTQPKMLKDPFKLLNGDRY